MVGKRKNTMRRTSSVSLIGAGSVSGDSSPLSEQHPPKEKPKASTYHSSGACHSAPRQVIGFHPKVYVDEVDVSSPISPHRAASPQSSGSKSPSGSPRSGLMDLLSSPRPWDRKDEGVGLGIVASLSGSQEEVCSEERDDGRGYGSRKTSPRGLTPSMFAPSRTSPPIPIHPTPHHSNSGRHFPTHCTDRDCCPSVAFGLGPPSNRPEPTLVEVNTIRQNGGSRPNPTTTSNGGPWSKSHAHNGGVAVNWTLNDMDVDRNELHAVVHPQAHFVRDNLFSFGGFAPNFLDACHLCRRRLGEGRDIYIYRGERAFCSPECRQHQIMSDERLEKCSAAVMKVGGRSGTATAAAA